jgi:hypothetical protein
MPSVAVASTAEATARKSPPPDPLLEEQQLVDGARSALARGALAEADRMLSEHARKFANGQLAPDRDALRVRLLQSQGRTDEAADLQRQFRLKYPTDPRTFR